MTAVALGVAALAGCGTVHQAASAVAGSTGRATSPRATASPDTVPNGGRVERSAAAGDRSPAAGRRGARTSGLPRSLPHLGPRTLAAVPKRARQVVVVTGRGRNSSRSSVVLYRRTPAGWRAGATWAARNALRGWTRDHHANDLRSPVGVFGLTDAGGLLPDPGTKLPYDHSSGFSLTGASLDGSSLAGTFDYVVAINYNRVAGVTPLDWTRPLGQGKGGGIWFHVDHGGPTHGCVAVSEQHMRDLLRTLDPKQHPVVVMGDPASLAR